jgi:hypothetical protein
LTNIVINIAAKSIAKALIAYLPLCPERNCFIGTKEDRAAIMKRAALKNISQFANVLSSETQIYKRNPVKNEPMPMIVNNNAVAERISTIRCQR